MKNINILSEISARSLHSHIYTEHLPKDLVNIEELFVFATAILRLPNTLTNMAIIWILTMRL